MISKRACADAAAISNTRPRISIHCASNSRCMKNLSVLESVICKTGQMPKCPPIVLVDAHFGLPVQFVCQDIRL